MKEKTKAYIQTLKLQDKKMNVHSLNTNNSKSFEAFHKKNKISSIILVISITISLLAGLYNYTIILGLNKDISLLEGKNTELADNILKLNEDIFLLNITNTESATKIDTLEKQQQRSLPEEYDFLLFSRNYFY